MHERFQLPVGIDNDANAAAIAEWKVGAGRGTDDMVMLTLGTGVGGGVIVGGRPLRGSVGAAGELGHMVIEFDGPPCQGVCTGRGHLEALVSGSAATIRAQEAFGPAVDAHRLIRLANDHDETALAILTDIGRKLGAAIGSLVNIFDPELIVIGGGFGAAAHDYLLGPAREVMLREALEPGRQTVRIVSAELGSSAGLIGAGFVAFEALDAFVVRRSPSAPPRSATSTTSRCGCSPSCDRPTSSSARTRATRAACSSGTAIEARLLSYHEHNEAARTAELLPRLRAGERIALVSDAGLPGINDPGARLVAAALDAGVPVTVLPGASAVETALVASGLVGERYQFLGYLPRAEQALAELWAELARWPHPAVAFESPKRLPRSLGSLARALPERRVAVCRELTKRFEEVVRGRADEVAGAVPRAAQGRDHARDRRRPRRPSPR